MLFSQGYELLVGVDKSAYSVWIGEELCEDINVNMNSITCLPPKSRPEDHLHPNTRVKVSKEIIAATIVDLRYRTVSENGLEF